jgi:spore germination protein GerM
VSRRRAVSAMTAAVAVVVTVAAVVGCGVPDSGVATIEPSELPKSLRSTTSVTSTVPGEPSSAQVALYWVRDDHLVGEPVSFEAPPDAERMLTLLLKGPGTGSLGGVRTAISDPEMVRDSIQRGSTVVVDLGPSFSDLTGSDQILAIGQLVASLTSIPGVSAVELRQGGDAVEVPIPDGTLVDRPLTRADYSELLT